MWWLIRHFLYLRKALTATDSPRQIAAGLTLGLLLGLVPKGSFLAMALAMILLGTRANIAVGMVAALVISLPAMWLDPLTHRLGDTLLGATALQGWWRWCFGLPLVPWTRLNNTVVMGSFTLGVTVSAPVYLLTKRLVVHLREKLPELEEAAGLSPSVAADTFEDESAEGAFAEGESVEVKVDALDGEPAGGPWSEVDGGIRRMAGERRQVAELHLRFPWLELPGVERAGGARRMPRRRSDAA